MMKIDHDITQRLNQLLRFQLTGINQYFLHSRMAGDWGLDQLKSDNYKASVHLMKAADKVIQRVLFLEALPNLQDLGRLRIGEHTAELLQGNLDFETEQRQAFVQAIAACEAAQDYVSRDMLEGLLEKAEEQIDELEAQIGLIAAIGIKNFNQSQMED